MRSDVCHVLIARCAGRKLVLPTLSLEVYLLVIASDLIGWKGRTGAQRHVSGSGLLTRFEITPDVDKMMKTSYENYFIIYYENEVLKITLTPECPSLVAKLTRCE